MVGCGDDEATPNADAGTNDASTAFDAETNADATTGDAAVANPDENWAYTPPARLPCTTTVEPSANDYDTVLGALIDAEDGDVICFGAGTFSFDEELSLSVNNVTLQGAGTGTDGTIWDFAGQAASTGAGANGLSVMADGFTMREIWVKNTPGDSVRVSNRTDVAFLGVKVTWDAGSVVTNGAYALYPVGSTNVLVEGCEVVGAADAGIYVGQSRNIIVRNNNVHGNVAGLEIENCVGADVYGNVAWDNTAGILVFDLPGLPAGNGHTTHVFQNDMIANNRANFARAGGVVAFVPPGLGFMSLASKNTEIDDNKLADNSSAGAVVVSYQTVEILTGEAQTDETYDPFASEIHFHDNTWERNGLAPANAAIVLAIMNSVDPVLTSLEDILWDGIANPEVTGDLLCIDESAADFRDFDAANLLGGSPMQSTDLSEHDCSFDSIPAVELELP